MNSTTIGSKNKKSSSLYNKNPIESIKDIGSSVTNTAKDQVKKMGSSIFDQFFGGSASEDRSEFEYLGSTREFKKQNLGQRKEFSIFNYQQYYEQEIVRREIRQLTEQIRKEIELIKKADSALLQEVKDIQNLTLESLPEKPGIYHIRFFEIILSILRTLRTKISESRTWMQAMISKKKKRGSLFAARSKSKGTLYSLSQELQSARSIQ
ncbi:hypothetical protein A2866_06725 [Candidatus Roizmanbacteria bacterium RIFCSPHIGHO2_01_FULL_39_8]|uniref:DUF5660 domain-containing protein n=3 Tax=Candidatus Roizmaniibacteriota TaxID=1752723 RepID=A0A1F7GLH4_9BACT|nr:MAG: hypothetical protein A2866_06725 [Candidatus Roizmanbacteria bacterium RIFCSPHIGHO2_01_FULL_39_8]OGK28102.1 MAG: hypothetical protein A3C28_05005 [Candidatus Roizmanbacteria bacterium RIFCSPHIGHO2_02_FULL_39_9]OGK35447.1 MAG: hypothetical protein A3F60_04185 [Candidatus Roizmanbacteria bacterium RIFCSPHIGHO2_12_FULL_39_8]